MAWWITDGILQRADAAPAASSIKTDITGKGNVVIPEGVTSIGNEAFYWCEHLTGITIPEGVTSIGEKAFHWCWQLKRISLPDSLTSIGDHAFSGCSYLTSIHISENHPAFYLENNLLISKEGTLIWCPSNTESVTIPNSVTSIGDQVFSACKYLTSIHISENHPAFYVENNLLISKKGTLIWGPTNAQTVTIPEGVTSISTAAFSLRSRLTDISIPEGVASIGDHAFSECQSLTSITIPDGVTSIGNAAFFRCYNLTSINIPDSVTFIGNEVFSWCESLTDIIIPAVHFTALDKDVRKALEIISCPISPKDAPANVRLKLCIGFALHEDKYSDELCTEYLAHIKKNAAKLVGAAFDYPELLHLMCREKLIPAKAIDAFTAEAAKRENVELTAVVLSYQNSLGAKEVTKARECKEKVRERQDETVIDRMAVRADKVGIDGLNFVVTGGLNHFAKRDDLKAYIAERGGKLMSAMSAKTDYLITNDTDSGSIKNKKAAELGIIVITEEEFLKMAKAQQ